MNPCERDSSNNNPLQFVRGESLNYCLTKCGVFGKHRVRLKKNISYVNEMRAKANTYANAIVHNHCSYIIINNTVPLI